MLAFEYGQPHGESDPSLGRVAAYARGPDYHDLIWQKLKPSGSSCEALDATADCRGVTDSAPLLERDFARRAGLGWFGKNTMLIEQAPRQFLLPRRRC